MNRIINIDFREEDQAIPIEPVTIPNKDQAEPLPTRRRTFWLAWQLLCSR